MENVTVSMLKFPYRIGETNAHATQEKVDRLDELLEPITLYLRQAYHTARPGQFIEIDLPTAVFEHIYEQEPTDSVSIIEAEIAVSRWLRNQLASSYMPTTLYIDITVQKHAWLSKIGLTSPKTVKNKALNPAIYAERCRVKNCSDFRFYCYFVKPLDA